MCPLKTFRLRLRLRMRQRMCVRLELRLELRLRLRLELLRLQLLQRLRKCSCCSTVMSPPVVSSRVQWHVHLKSWNVILTLLAPEISPTALAFTWRHHKDTGSKVRSPSSRTSLICISVSFHFLNCGCWCYSSVTTEAT